MLNTATLTVMTVPRVAVPASVDRSRREPTASDPIRSASAPSDSTRTPDASIARRIADTMQLIEDALAPQRRVIHAGDPIYRAGDRFGHLYLLNSGLAKVVGLSSDGREQVVGLKFRGDWIGFDGIANDRYTCDAIAMDTGEVWVIRYEDLLSACRREPSLLKVLHAAMSREIGRDRDSLMSVCTLPADARVADFLRYWAESLSIRGMRTDQITLRMTRAEIGNYLGLTLETVSRALSRLARCNVIAFAEKGRREISIPEFGALGQFVQQCLVPVPATLQ
jgi:CRP/FNR family transcriptional regulator, anaerobic regulatory protein